MGSKSKADSRQPQALTLTLFPHPLTLTQVGEDTGSSATHAIGAWKFQESIRRYTNPCSPIWDERGLLCYRRDGTRAFRIIVCASCRLHDGLYSAKHLRPLACFQLALFGLLASPWTILQRVLAWLWALVGAGQPPLPRVPPPLQDPSAVDLPLPPVGAGWGEHVVTPVCGGIVRLRVRVSAWEDRIVSEGAYNAFQMIHHVLESSDGENAVLTQTLTLTIPISVATTSLRALMVRSAVHALSYAHASKCTHWSVHCVWRRREAHAQPPP